MKNKASIIMVILGMSLSGFSQLKPATTATNSSKSRVLSGPIQQIDELYAGTLDILQDGVGLTHTSLDGTLSMGTYVNASGGWLQTHTNHALTFSTISGIPQLRLFTNGNFSIGPQFPFAHLTVNGYSKLGYNAPAIQIKRFDGVTSSSQYGNYIITHGLDASKIISINVIIELIVANEFIPQNTEKNNLGVSTSYDANSIFVQNSSTANSVVLNKPFKLTVIYKEN